MAYGKKYTWTKTHSNGEKVTLSIWADGWTGASYEIGALVGFNLQILGDQNSITSPIVKTSVNISIKDVFDVGTTQADGTTCVEAGKKWGQWEEFYTNNPTKFLVTIDVVGVRRNGRIWSGYLTPDSWGEEMVYRGSINLTARDMIGYLDEQEFDMTGTVSVRQIITQALARSSTQMTADIRTAQCLYNQNNQSILDASIQASTYSGKTWYQALEQTLEALGLVMRYGGQNNLIITSVRHIDDVNINDDDEAAFTGRGGYRELDPAIKQIVETFNPKFVTVAAADPDSTRFLIQSGYYEQTYRAGSQTVTHRSLRKYQVSADTDGNGWRGDLAVKNEVSEDNLSSRLLFLPTDCEGGYLEYRRSGLTAPAGITINAILAAAWGTWSVAPEASFAIGKIKLQIRISVSGVDRYLDELGVWGNVEATIDAAPGMKIEVPELSGAGDIYVKVLKVETDCKALPYGPLAAALLLDFDGPEYGDLAAEYKTTTVYNEDNHVEVTRTPSIGSADTSMSSAYAGNILSYGNVAAGDMWNFSDMNGYYPLAVMVHAQLLVFNASQNGNSIFTGALVDLTYPLAYPGVSFSYFEKHCVLLSGTFDLCTGWISSAVLREALSWADVWGTSFDPQYTQKESSQTGGTAASGGGGGSSGGGGGQGGGVRSVALTMPTGFSVEGSPITGSGEFQVGFAEGYSLLTPEARAILNLFGIDEDGNVYLKKDANNNPRSFYAYGEITAGGPGQGGDTPSGALYSLVDVSHSGVNILRADGTARQNGDALVFNTVQNKWVASAIQGGASSFSQLTGSPYDNASLATALNGKQDAISDLATIRSQAANGQTAYGWGNHANAGYITGITSSMVTTALGYTPYNAANIGSASVAYATSAGYVNGALASSQDGWGSVNYSFAWNDWALTEALGSYYHGFTQVSPDAHIGYSIAYSFTNNSLYWREYSSYGSGWYDWKELYHSGNFNPANYQPLATAINTGNIGSQSVASLYQQASLSTQAEVNAFHEGSKLKIAYLGNSVFPEFTDGIVLSAGFGTTYGHQLHLDDNVNVMWHRACANGTWLPWVKVYDSGNCNNASTPWSCSNLTASGTGNYIGPRTQNNGGTLVVSSASNGNSTIDISNCAIMVGPPYGRSTFGYLSGIGFNQLMNYSSDYLNTINAWIGIKVYDTPGTERASLVFAMKDSTTDHNPSEKMVLDPFGNLSAVGEVSAGSDARWKHNITPVLNGIDTIMKLQPSEWEWNSDNHKGSGLIAQSVQSVLPHLVKEDGEGYLHLTYDGLHAYEISAIQSHETRIQRLERENAELKRMLHINS